MIGTRRFSSSLRRCSGRSPSRLLLGGLLACIGAASASSAIEGEDGRLARLERALDVYARALSEPRRDERIALFAEAEGGFASLVAEGTESVALYTNLGNAALQAEHPGRAVLAYRRALRLDPEADTARQNLIHARGLLPGWVPRPDPSEGVRPLVFYRTLSPGLRAQAAAACFAFAGVCLVLSVRRRTGAWRGLAIVAIASWALLLGSVVFDALGEGGGSAVITADETPARSADSALSPLALPEPLPAGTEVELVEVRDDWSRARLANGRDVWIRSSRVTPVRPSDRPGELRGRPTAPGS